MQTADNDNLGHDHEETSHHTPLSPAAQRALREAEQRRKLAAAKSVPEEFGGRGGADPARFGDWEINGRAVDF